MISYNTKEWLGIFRIHRADTFRKLFPLILAMAIYTALVVYVERLFNLSKDNPLHSITALHGIVGFALSMLLVFRTNTAYDRWWEGRRHWGSLVNQSRNLALKLSSLIPEHPEELAFFAAAIPRFAFELMSHLRETSTKLEMDEKPHPEIPDFDRKAHVPAQVSALMLKRIQKLRRDKLLAPEDVLFVNTELSSFMDICGACERIRNTPIPFSYSAFIKKFIFIYVVTLPFGFAFSMGYLSVVIVALIFYILGSLEIIAEEIEEPFGADENDLPMGRLCHKIQKTVEEILIPGADVGSR